MPLERQRRFFGRKQRLSNKHFSTVIHTGRVLRGRGLTVLLKESGQEGARFGVIVPKNIVALAAHRNRSKRLLREWFRHNRERLLGKDCVIRVTAPMENIAGEGTRIVELERLLRAAFAGTRS